MYLNMKKALAFASAFFLAEEKGFEPLQRFHTLRDFESIDEKEDK